MRFFRVRPDEASSHLGEVDGQTRWGLPGIECPACGSDWSNIGEVYPTVDLSDLAEWEAFEGARSASPEEYARLRERVRPLAPPGAPLLPGAEFGPFIASTVSGRFGDFYFLQPWWLMVKPEALEKLQAEGIRGLSGVRVEMRTGSKQAAPELLHLEISARGRLHPPEERKPPCRRCGRDAFTLPKAPVLEGASLPEDVDLFRLANFTTVIVASERFVQAVEHLGLKEIVFKPLTVR